MSSNLIFFIQLLWLGVATEHHGSDNPLFTPDVLPGTTLPIDLGTTMHRTVTIYLLDSLVAPVALDKGNWN